MSSPSRDQPMMDPIVMERRKKKNARLQSLRSRERLNSIVKAEAYRRELHKADEAMQARMAFAAEHERMEELQQVQDQLQKRMHGVGQAQVDAALYKEQHEQQQQLQQQRRAEQEVALRQRSQAALQRARDERRARTEPLESHKALREAILSSERNKAKSMAEEQRARSQQQQQDQQLLDLLEWQRRRQNQHSIVDFRFSRLHEVVPYTHQVESSRVEEPAQPIPDPVVAAADTAARLLDIEREKAAAAALAKERAQQRYLAAQAKLRAEQERRKLEVDLEAAAATEVQRKKQALEDARGHVLDRRKQETLERIFEDNFLKPSSGIGRQLSPGTTRSAPVPGVFVAVDAHEQPRQVPRSLMPHSRRPTASVRPQAGQAASVVAPAAPAASCASVSGPGALPVPGMAAPAAPEAASVSNAAAVGHQASAPLQPSAVPVAARAPAQGPVTVAGVTGSVATASAPAPQAATVLGIPPLPLPYWSRGRNARLGTRPHGSRSAAGRRQAQGAQPALGYGPDHIPPSGIPLPSPGQVQPGDSGSLTGTGVGHLPSGPRALASGSAGGASGQGLEGSASQGRQQVAHQDLRQPVAPDRPPHTATEVAMAQAVAAAASFFQRRAEQGARDRLAPATVLAPVPNPSTAPAAQTLGTASDRSAEPGDGQSQQGGHGERSTSRAVDEAGGDAAGREAPEHIQTAVGANPGTSSIRQDSQRGDAAGRTSARGATDPQSPIPNLSSLLAPLSTGGSSASGSTTTTSSMSGELEELLRRAASQQGPTAAGIAAALAAAGLLPSNGTRRHAPKGVGRDVSAALAGVVASSGSSAGASPYGSSLPSASGSSNSGTPASSLSLTAGSSGDVRTSGGMSLEGSLADQGAGAASVSGGRRRYLAGVDLAALLAPLPPVPEVEEEDETQLQESGPAASDNRALIAAGAAAADLLEAQADAELRRALETTADWDRGSPGSPSITDSPDGLPGGSGHESSSAALRELLASATEGLFGSSRRRGGAQPSTVGAVGRAGGTDGVGALPSQVLSSAMAGLFDDTLSSLGSDTVSSSVDRLLFGSLLGDTPRLNEDSAQALRRIPVPLNSTIGDSPLSMYSDSPAQDPAAGPGRGGAAPLGLPANPSAEDQQRRLRQQQYLFSPGRASSPPMPDDGASSIVSELSQLAREGEELALRIKAAMAAPVGTGRLPFAQARGGRPLGSQPRRPLQGPIAGLPAPAPALASASAPAYAVPTMVPAPAPSLAPTGVHSSSMGSTAPAASRPAATTAASTFDLAGLDALLAQSMERLGIASLSALSPSTEGQSQGRPSFPPAVPGFRAPAAATAPTPQAASEGLRVDILTRPVPDLGGQAQVNRANPDPYPGLRLPSAARALTDDVSLSSFSAVSSSAAPSLSTILAELDRLTMPSYKPPEELSSLGQRTFPPQQPSQQQRQGQGDPSERMPPPLTGAEGALGGAASSSSGTSSSALSLSSILPMGGQGGSGSAPTHPPLSGSSGSSSSIGLSSILGPATTGMGSQQPLRPQTLGSLASHPLPPGSSSSSSGLSSALGLGLMQFRGSGAGMGTDGVSLGDIALLPRFMATGAAGATEAQPVAGSRALLPTVTDLPAASAASSGQAAAAPAQEAGATEALSLQAFPNAPVSDTGSGSVVLSSILSSSITLSSGTGSGSTAVLSSISGVSSSTVNLSSGGGSSSGTLLSSISGGSGRNLFSEVANSSSGVNPSARPDDGGVGRPGYDGRVGATQAQGDVSRASVAALASARDLAAAAEAVTGARQSSAAVDISAGGHDNDTERPHAADSSKDLGQAPRRPEALEPGGVQRPVGAAKGRAGDGNDGLAAKSQERAAAAGTVGGSNLALLDEGFFDLKEADDDLLSSLSIPRHRSRLADSPQPSGQDPSQGLAHSPSRLGGIVEGVGGAAVSPVWASLSGASLLEALDAMQSQLERTSLQTSALLADSNLLAAPTADGSGPALAHSGSVPAVSEQEAGRIASGAGVGGPPGPDSDRGGHHAAHASHGLAGQDLYMGWQPSGVEGLGQPSKQRGRDDPEPDTRGQGSHAQSTWQMAEVAGSGVLESFPGGVDESLDSDGFADMMSGLLTDINRGLAAMRGVDQAQGGAVAGQQGDPIGMVKEPSFGDLSQLDGPEVSF